MSALCVIASIWNTIHCRGRTTSNSLTDLLVGDSAPFHLSLLTRTTHKSIMESMKIVCPLCGSATSFNPAWVEKQGILREESTKQSTVRGKVAVTLIQEPYEYGIAQYGILWCGACEKHIVVENGEYAKEGDWQVVYPIACKVASEYIPKPIKRVFEEANLCFAIGAYIACVSMCQIALEALWRDKGVSNLKELVEKGMISSQLYERANEIRLWGNVVKHEFVSEAVSREDAEELLGYLEALLDHVYVQPARLAVLKRKRKQSEASSSLQ